MNRLILASKLSRAALATIAALPLATGCSSADPGSLEAHRASLGPGGSMNAGGDGGGSSSGTTSSGSGSGSSSGGTTSSGGSSSGGSSSGGSTSSGSSSGGSSGSSSGSSSGGAGDAGVSTDLLQHCVDSINSYRAQLGVPAYARSSALEAFAATGAQSDGESGMAHGHFIGTNGGNGVAFAENEIPGWPLAQYSSLTDIVDQGFKMMWDEGPGGGHYENMSSTMYTQTGCGTYTTSDGSVWVTTDFR